LITIRRANRRAVRIKITPALAERAKTTPGARRWTGRRSAIIAFNAQNTARARIGIEPQNPAVGRQPFQAVMRVACGTHVRPLHVRQIAGTLTPDSVENFAERTHIAGLHALAGAIRLRICRRGQSGTQNEGN
jgi:hypothetical protein